MKKIILCDIGNTTADIYENGVCQKMILSEFKPELLAGDVWYVSVNHALSERLQSLPNWHNIVTLIDWDKYYLTMGIDRIMVCEAIDDGVIVDAGSAITVDVMRDGVYQGGFISLGLRAAQEAYARLSPALALSFNFEVDLTIMAKNTPDAITVGFLAPLIQSIKSYGNPIYVTGGDAHLLSSFLEEVIVDETLIFKGMKKLIDKGSKC
ncbi:MAG: type III pantothenate kinase [Sulfuricurvum sp.]|nr:type III pantothenate kinase [Sulfuricurvum sp.]MDD5386467.1 type III pantothenate kinase [Sulfuricurvum sp.]